MKSTLAVVFVACVAVDVQGMAINSATRRSVVNGFAGALTAATIYKNPEAAFAEERERSAVIPGLAGGAKFVNDVVDESSMNGEAWNPQNLVTKLAKSKILATELVPLSTPLTPFAKDNELFYDDFLLGTWDTTATLRRKIYPYGPSFLPSSSLYDGSPRNRDEKPGDTYTYQTRYIPLGEKGKVIADRDFNARSLSSSYKQLSQISQFQWNPNKDPTRASITFSTISEDLRPLGQKKAEIYITARKSESAVDTVTNESVFGSSERLRSVAVVPGNVVVSDTETITEFRVVDGSNGEHMKATCRIAVYLTPNPNSREGLLWQDVNGKAVAFFDYEMDMKKAQI